MEKSKSKNVSDIYTMRLQEYLAFTDFLDSNISIKPPEIFISDRAF